MFGQSNLVHKSTWNYQRHLKHMMLHLDMDYLHKDQMQLDNYRRNILTKDS